MMGQGFFSFLNVGLARKGSHPRRRQTGLCLLTLFLGVSGVIRLGNGIGLAYAETSKSPSPVAGAAPTGAGTAEPVASGTSATGATCPADAGALAMLQSLKEREGRLAEQEANAAEKEQSLALARVAVDQKIADLRTAEAKLASTIAMADQAADKDVSQLVTVYESMKPKDAARLFGEMDPNFAAGFLAKMRPEAAAAILSGLDPQKAYLISVTFAGRNAEAPKS